MQSQDQPQRPIVLMEDDPIHTLQTPFCLDGTCPCHESSELVDLVAQQVSAGLLTPAEASRLVSGQQA